MTFLSSLYSHQQFCSASHQKTMDCLNYLFLIGRAVLEESVHQFRGCICFLVCDTFPRSTCILWGLKHLLMKERGLRCNSARGDYAFSGAICNFRVWKEEENVVSLTGESLSGAGISCSKLAGAASRMGLMEDWMISVLFKCLGAEGRDTGSVSLCSLGNWVNSSVLALVLCSCPLRLVCILLVDIRAVEKLLKPMYALL